ncbi:hypothetical protein BGZ91_005175 [Linnemannia elongata]|nr:hypothetical protein BGZ91_005175 [Linnemannia elongata]KAG0081479.1 hypothetical protein BGZ90_007938 [Linnemannia elongata]
MATHCNNSNSSSQFPSVCCVHNTESQPLLGHHSGHHTSGSSQYQHQPPPPDYYVDMSGNNKGGHCTSSHAPFQQQCHCQQHYHNHHHHRHHSDNQSDCSRTSRQRDTTRCGGILIGLFFVFFFIFVSSTGSGHSRPSGPWNAASGSTAANLNGLDLLSNDSNNLNFDRCRDNAIEWDGPSTFTTDAKNFRLKIGEGNIFSRVNISTGPVALPTFHILGEVSPYEDNVKNSKPTISRREKVNIDYLGLHVEIVEMDNQFDAQVWYDNREVVDPRDGQHYRACARLYVEVILPESFTSYGSITIEGPVVVINAHDLENVKFDSLHFGSSVGEISTRGRIQSDIFDAKSNTGRIRAEAVQVATAGKPLDIQISSIIGGVQLTAETTEVDASEENPHKVHVSTETGRIELTVQPSTSSAIDTKHGNLDISTTAVTGSIDSTISLASQDQILTLTSKTNTGSIRSHISDAFLGHFALSTKWGSAHVEPARDSKSTITYEKVNAREKIGSKTLEGAESVAGLIEISTIAGSTSLEFTN